MKTSAVPLAGTDFLSEAGWGVFSHYLAEKVVDSGQGITADEWNRAVDSFDVGLLADQLEQVGAGYHVITIGQNSGFYLGPNVTYDDIVGHEVSHCSRRDLIAEIAGEMSGRGIHTLVYLPAGAPDRDERAKTMLGWRAGEHPVHRRPPRGQDEEGRPWGELNPRLPDFQRKWEAIIGEWAGRWGARVRGWWFDGCYYPEMYEYPEAPNWGSFVAAARSGNPDGIVAFNPGVMADLKILTERQDYTAGEINDEFPTCRDRWIHGVQWHVLSYLGDTWGAGEAPRLSDQFVAEYTAQAVANGGAVSWDVPVLADGHIPAAFLEQLMAIGASAGRGGG